MGKVTRYESTTPAYYVDERVDPVALKGIKGWNKGMVHREHKATLRKTYEAQVELSIDVEALIRQLGPRAGASKGGVARMAGGAIKCKRLSQRLVNERRIQTDIRLSYPEESWEVIES